MVSEEQTFYSFMMMHFAVNQEGFKEFIYNLSSQKMYLNYGMFSMQKMSPVTVILLLYIISLDQYLCLICKSKGLRTGYCSNGS